MKQKLKRFFSSRTIGTTEISGSATSSNDAFNHFLLPNNTNNDDNDWDAWSNDIEGDRGRGRADSRSRNQRSQSERPSRRKRSKSEVGKRLKRLELDVDLGEGKSTKPVRGSRSTGGVFRGNRSEVRSKIDSLTLERYSADSRLSIDDVATSSIKMTKKLRGGRRHKSIVDNTNGIAITKDTKPRRSRSASRTRRSSMTDIGGDSIRDRGSFRKPKRSSSVKGRLSKSMIEVTDIQPVLDDEKNSVSTITTKEDSKKKKKKKSDKKKRNKNIKDDSTNFSVPSKVEMSNECESYGSVTIPESPKAKKKKAKDKSKKSKKNKSKSDIPSLPLDDFGDGLEGLAEEFRKSKESYVDKNSKFFASECKPLNEDFNTTKDNNYTKVTNMFENAWTGIGESDGSSITKGRGEKESLNPFDRIESSNLLANNVPKNQVGDCKVVNPFMIENCDNQSNENEILRQAVDFQVTHTEINHHQEEISRLQQQLSTALQKQVTMSEEHIQEKDEFLQVSRELERIKVELAESLEERGEITEELKKREEIIDGSKNRIDTLEKAIDKQLEKEEEFERKLRLSEEEVGKLLDEIQNFEKKLDNGETVDGGASFVELRNAKKSLAEKEETIISQKLRIEELVEELKESLTVPQLQIEELDQENKALQGRLKGERLEYTSKLSNRDEIISNLRTELASYTASSDAQDLQSARQKLHEAREDATTVREDLIAARKIIEKLHEEREDLTEKYNLLKENSIFMEKTVKELNEKSDNLRAKVLEWTEKTYDWKQKAESAERKLEAYNEDKAADDKGGSMESENLADAAPQGLFLHAAMEKGKKNSEKGRSRSSVVSTRNSSWGIFKNNVENKEPEAEEIRIRILEEQNHDFEARIAELNSELVKMQTAHKEELYMTKKKIARLEGENEALVLQNSTLEKLRET